MAIDQSIRKEEDARAHERESEKRRKRHEEMKAVTAQRADVEVALSAAKVRF